MYYTYANDIVFSTLKSNRRTSEAKTEFEDADASRIACSPKSMYRFADYVHIPIQLSILNAHDVDSSLQADIPVLKSLAKKAISRNLSQSNIINELFSSFTHKYQEIIELEVDFLVANFTPNVARQLDEMLQLLVLGTNPRSFRVLAFTMRRLRGDSAEKTWGALDVDVGSVPTPDLDSESPLPSPPSSKDSQRKLEPALERFDEKWANKTPLDSSQWGFASPVVVPFGASHSENPEQGNASTGLFGLGGKAKKKVQRKV